MYTSDIAVIGAGPVGLFAVFQAGMLGMSTVVIDSLPHIGGQCSALYPEKPIYDIPAYPKISAEDLIQKLHEQALPFAPRFILGESVIACKKGDASDSKFFEIITDSGTKIYAKAVLIAAGSGAFGHNRPPIHNIAEFENRTVFYMVKERQIFANKVVSIAGGGDSAVDWALSLSEVANKIYFIHRRDKFKAIPDNVSKLHEIVKSGRIELVIPYQLHSIKGPDGIMNELGLVDLDGNIRIIQSDFLLPFFGLSSDLSAIASFGIEIEQKCIKVDPSTMQTNADGIFAIGDVVNYAGKLKLILTGFSEAAIAAHSAYRFIYPEKHLHFEHSTTKGVSGI